MAPDRAVERGGVVLRSSAGNTCFSVLCYEVRECETAGYLHSACVILPPLSMSASAWRTGCDPYRLGTPVDLFVRAVVRAFSRLLLVAVVLVVVLVVLVLLLLLLLLLFIVAGVVVVVDVCVVVVVVAWVQLPMLLFRPTLMVLAATYRCTGP